MPLSQEPRPMRTMNEFLERLRIDIQRLRETVRAKREAKPAGRIETAHSAIERILRTQACIGRRL